MLWSRRMIIGLAVLFFAAYGMTTPSLAQEEEAAKPGLTLVAGATGNTGRRLIAALKAQGIPVRAMTRSLENAHEKVGTDYDWVVADVTDITTLPAALDGVENVISTLGARRTDANNTPEAVDYGGVKNLVDAAKQAGVKHFVLMSSTSVTAGPDHFLNKNFDNLLMWKFKAEEHLRQSGLDYTVVRSAGLRNNYEPGMGILFTQGDKAPGGLITYDDVIAVLIESLSNPEAKNKTFEIMNYKAFIPKTWPAQLKTLAPDS